MMHSRRLHVLVVDDDEEDVLLLREALQDYAPGQFIVDWADSLDAGRVAMARNAHDAYLVDYRLGHEDGLELVREARDRPGSMQAVLVMTGVGDREVDRRALEAGALDYIVKGDYDGAQVARALRYAVEVTRQMEEIEQRKRHYQHLFDANPLPVYVFDRETLALVAVNRAMVEAYGYSEEDLLRMRVTDLRSPEEAQRLEAFLPTLGEDIASAGVWEHRRADGTPMWAEIRTHGIDLNGRSCRIVIARDITAEREAQARLKLLERAVNSSTSGIVVADARQPDMPLILCNAAFERITGYREEEVIGRNCRFLNWPDRGQPPLELVRHSLRQGEDCNVIVRNFRKDGSSFWNDLYVSPIRDESGEITHYVGVQNDITARREVEEELAHAAAHDPITGLPRFQVVEPGLARALTGPVGRAAVLFIDIDRFHNINETMGHAFGDTVLRKLGWRVARAAGSGAVTARFAGDDFVVILPGAGAERACEVGARIRGALARPFDGGSYQLQVTASVGISYGPEHGTTPKDLVRRAEAAKDEAKRIGRDNLHVFSQQDMQQVEDRLNLGANLREATRWGELQLHYQPLVDATTGRVCSVEALLRWTQRTHGVVPPDRFVPVAEALGLMPEIGRWVIHEACRQLRVWHDMGLTGVSVGINLSAQELQRPGIVELIREALAENGIHGRHLDIEITESSLMEHVERVADVIMELKRLGLSLSLDDFGTGYSSLAYLNHFALDKLKIDRSFVRRLGRDPGADAITRAIVAMAHELGLRVVAEGVETPAQAQRLREYGCDIFQGYLYGRPVDAGSVERMLMHQVAADV